MMEDDPPKRSSVVDFWRERGGGEQVTPTKLIPLTPATPSTASTTASSLTAAEETTTPPSRTKAREEEKKESENSDTEQPGRLAAISPPKKATSRPPPIHSDNPGSTRMLPAAPLTAKNRDDILSVLSHSFDQDDEQDEEVIQKKQLQDHDATGEGRPLAAGSASLSVQANGFTAPVGHSVVVFPLDEDDGPLLKLPPPRTKKKLFSADNVSSTSHEISSPQRINSDTSNISDGDTSKKPSVKSRWKAAVNNRESNNSLNKTVSNESTNAEAINELFGAKKYNSNNENPKSTFVKDPAETSRNKVASFHQLKQRQANSSSCNINVGGRLSAAERWSKRVNKAEDQSQNRELDQPHDRPNPDQALTPPREQTLDIIPNDEALAPNQDGNNLKSNEIAVGSDGERQSSRISVIARWQNSQQQRQEEKKQQPKSRQKEEHSTEESPKTTEVYTGASEDGNTTRRISVVDRWAKKMNESGVTTIAADTLSSAKKKEQNDLASTRTGNGRINFSNRQLTTSTTDNEAVSNSDIAPATTLTGEPAPFTSGERGQQDFRSVHRQGPFTRSHKSIAATTNDEIQEVTLRTELSTESHQQDQEDCDITTNDTLSKESPSARAEELTHPQRELYQSSAEKISRSWEKRAGQDETNSFKKNISMWQESSPFKKSSPTERKFLPPTKKKISPLEERLLAQAEKITQSESPTPIKKLSPLQEKLLLQAEKITVAEQNDSSDSNSEKLFSSADKGIRSVPDETKVGLDRESPSPESKKIAPWQNTQRDSTMLSQTGTSDRRVSVLDRWSKHLNQIPDTSLPPPEPIVPAESRSSRLSIIDKWSQWEKNNAESSDQPGSSILAQLSAEEDKANPRKSVTETWRQRQRGDESSEFQGTCLPTAQPADAPKLSQTSAIDNSAGNSCLSDNVDASFHGVEKDDTTGEDTPSSKVTTISEDFVNDLVEGLGSEQDQREEENSKVYQEQTNDNVEGLDEVDPISPRSMSAGESEGSSMAASQAYQSDSTGELSAKRLGAIPFSSLVRQEQRESMDPDPLLENMHVDHTALAEQRTMHDDHAALAEQRTHDALEPSGIVAGGKTASDSSGLECILSSGSNQFDVLLYSDTGEPGAGEPGRKCLLSTRTDKVEEKSSLVDAKLHERSASSTSSGSNLRRRVRETLAQKKRRLKEQRRKRIESDDGSSDVTSELNNDIYSLPSITSMPSREFSQASADDKRQDPPSSGTPTFRYATEPKPCIKVPESSPVNVGWGSRIDEDTGTGTGESREDFVRRGLIPHPALNGLSHSQNSMSMDPSQYPSPTSLTNQANRSNMQLHSMDPYEIPSERSRPISESGQSGFSSSAVGSAFSGYNSVPSGASKSSYSTLASRAERKLQGRRRRQFSQDDVQQQARDIARNLAPPVGVPQSINTGRTTSRSSDTSKIAGKYETSSRFMDSDSGRAPRTKDPDAVKSNLSFHSEGSAGDSRSFGSAEVKTSSRKKRDRHRSSRKHHTGNSQSNRLLSDEFSDAFQSAFNLDIQSLTSQVKGMSERLATDINEGISAASESLHKYLDDDPPTSNDSRRKVRGRAEHPSDERVSIEVAYIAESTEENFDDEFGESGAGSQLPITGDDDEHNNCYNPTTPSHENDGTFRELRALI